MDQPTDRWKRIQPVLERALELEPDQVGAYLDHACGDDAAFRAELESLIEADRAAPAFLDSPAVTLPRSVGSDRVLDGEQLGPFRVLHEIGRGGMSIVYLAERADGQFEQTVAIKVLMHDARSRDLAVRFEAERRILASLDHRGIVRIQDGGMTRDGRPYLVMEHVEGDRIDRYCDANQLPVAQRLRIFRQVLDAVAYAHRALVVHRDLKPANILVTEQGQVRLLDFGIAKLLDPDDPSDSPPTRTGLRAMTPEYAAPEQVRGERITTATDIYALGVLLYELLTGHRPYAEDSPTPFALEQAILDADPERPSEAALRRTKSGSHTGRGDVEPEAIAAARATEPQQLRSTLDGDLDAIVLKALRKEPEERYGSAHALAEDIDRYLGSLPVLARRDSRAYRMRKFVRRHRVGVAIAAAASLLVIGSTVAIAASRETAQQARIAAEQEARTAREVTDFLIGIFGGSNPYETLGDSVSARTLLERGRERIATELVDQPIVRASLLHAIGNVYSELGRYESADTLLQQALELRRTQYGDQHVSVSRTVEALVDNSIARRDFALARGHVEQALTLRRAIGFDGLAGEANLLRSLSLTQRELGHTDSALTTITRALAMDSTRGDSTSGSHLMRRVELAVTLRARGDFAGATRVYADVLPKLRDTYGDLHPNVSTAVNNAAFLLTRQGRWAEAVPLYREAVDVQRRIFGQHHPRVMQFQSNLASALIESGALDEGVDVLRERVLAAEGAWPDGHWRIGASYEGLGKALLRSERFGEAETALRAAATSYAATLGPHHSWTRVAEVWVVTAMTLGGDATGARALERGLQRLSDAPLDNDNRFNIRQIADHLEAAGFADLAERYRALVE